ncbi:zinc ribbon domain-containing protein [soil metagenome]
MGKFSQSCAMPMSKDPRRGGRNRDGSTSTEYCSYCYVNGAFVHPEMSVKEMQIFCAGKLREAGMNSLFAWLLTRSIPRLKRWAL